MPRVGKKKVIKKRKLKNMKINEQKKYNISFLYIIYPYIMK